MRVSTDAYWYYYEPPRIRLIQLECNQGSSCAANYFVQSDLNHADKSADKEPMMLAQQYFDPLVGSDPCGAR